MQKKILTKNNSYTPLDDASDPCYGKGRRERRRDQMYNFVTEEKEATTESITSLVDVLLCMENEGAMNDEDVDECIYYLQKISELTGVGVNFDDYYEEET